MEPREACAQALATDAAAYGCGSRTGSPASAACTAVRRYARGSTPASFALSALEQRVEGQYSPDPVVISSSKQA